MMWSKRCDNSAVVSGMPPSTMRMARVSRYRGMSAANTFETCGANSLGLSTTALPAAPR